MNDSIHVTRRPRRARPPTARTAAAVIATTGLALLAAACASPSSTGTSGPSNAAAAANVQATNSPGALAYTHCMRSHGVPNFPNPDSSGNIPDSAKQIAAAHPQAEAACSNLLQNGSQSSQDKPAPSDTQNQPSQGKGDNTQNQPSSPKPSSGGGQ